MNGKSLILGALLLALSWPAPGAELESRAEIARAAERHLAERLAGRFEEAPRIEAGRLDPRLRLARCTVPLEAFLPPGGREIGSTTVGVRCNGDKRWTLYVPVKVTVFTQVVVAARSLPRGQLLSASDLSLARRDLARLPQGYFRDPAEVAGQQLKRNVTAGQALTPALLKAPRTIRRGERVTLVAGGNGVEVRMPGIALNNAARGETVRVRNVSSKRIVLGVVAGPGLVQVGR